MKIIAGLGNPGKRYAGTRHNVGFMILDMLAKLVSVRFKKSFLNKAYIAKTRKSGDDVLLVKPFVFMNNSGVCLEKTMFRYGVKINDILVVYDDADLSAGVLRFRTKGRSAGHKGMDSIIQYLGTDLIQRVRVGIGKPGNSEELADYVLSDFTDNEREILDETVDKACHCCLAWADKSADFVMRECN